MRKFPLNPGIDVVGTVIDSAAPTIKEKEKVIITGWGMGEIHDGGYSEVVRVPASWALPLPSGLTAREAMIMGTAGLTAALCLYRLEANGQTPDMGPIVVTGSTGGVGSLAIAMLKEKGYQIHAVTGKIGESDYLRSLGADHVTDIKGLNLGSGPLASARFGGAIDCIGGSVLAGILRHVTHWGTVISVGLAGGSQLETSIMPLILRGVGLLGVSASNCSAELRHFLWAKMTKELSKGVLDTILSGVISLEDVSKYSHKMLDRQTKGRFVIQLK